jgi:hypothetical protein
MLLNFSNHPSSEWPEKQILEANRLFGSVMDLSFPDIPPDASYEEIIKLADQYADKILHLKNKYELISLHVMGEFTFTYNLIKKMEEVGIPCYASTTARTAEEIAENNVIKKLSRFEFVAFRRYF